MSRLAIPHNPRPRTIPTYIYTTIVKHHKPQTFEELATRAHNMELSIAHHGKKKPISDFKKDKVFASKVDNHGKKPAK